MAWETTFLDGFDHYATADILSKWDDINAAQVTNGATRNSVGALALGSGSAVRAVKYVKPSSSFCIGFGVRLAAPSVATGYSSTRVTVLGLFNSSSGTEAQLALCMFSDGKFRVARCTEVQGNGNLTGAVELGEGTFVASTDVYYYVEIQVFLDDVDGTVEVRVDGVPDIVLTGVDTVSQAYSTASRVRFGSPAGSTWTYYDDLYVRQDFVATTPPAAGFLGDIAIRPYYPNADGTYTAWTPSEGTDHYALVDETSPNTTDWVESDSALAKNSFAFEDTSETDAIKAVQLNAYTYKADAGFRGIDLFCKSAATEDFTLTYRPLSVTPQYARKVWEQDPNTAVDWTLSGFNAAEFGVRIADEL
jgi:hypothetical protein